MTPGGEPARTLRSVPEQPDAQAPEPREGWLRAHFEQWRGVYLAFAFSRALVLLIGFGSELFARVTDRDPASWRPFGFAETYPHYADVATNGYTLQNAFDYPLLPALMAGFDTVGIPFAVTAFVISNVAFLFGLLGFAALGERYVGRTAAVRGATYLALAPFAYWFSIASTEAMLFALLAGSTLLALRATPGAWMGAGALAALAAMTRPPGALLGLLLLGIAIGQLRDGRLQGRGIAAALAAGAAIPAAIAAFFGYLNAKTGDPLAALHAQEQFNRHTSLTGPIHALESGVRNTLAGSMGQAVELAATIGAAGLIVWFATSAAGRRWEIRGWTLFAAASLLMPLATSVLWQMPRFILIVPPVFWALGKLTEGRVWLHRALLITFPLALAVKTATAVIGVHG